MGGNDGGSPRNTKTLDILEFIINNKYYEQIIIITMILGIFESDIFVQYLL